MSTLEGHPWSTTFQNFIQAPTSGQGITALPRVLEDGKGTATAFVAGTGAGGFNGWLFADLSTAASDVASSLAYYDTLANSLGLTTLAITKPGSYFLSSVVFSHVARFIQGPDVNFMSPSSLASTTFMIDVKRSRFVFDCLGTINGRRTSQSSAIAISGFHSYQNSHVTINGYGIGRATGFTYHGVWLRDGDDLVCEGMKGDDCQYDPIYFEAVTKNTYRWRASNNFIDRRAETGNAGDAGCLKAQNTSADAYSTVFMHDILFDNNTILAPTSMTNVAVEIWGGAKNAWVRGGSVVGPRLGFAVSLDHVIGGGVMGVDIRSYGSLGIESAGSSNIRIISNRLTDGASGGGGIIIDNQTVAGSTFLVAHNEIHAGATATFGIKAKGAASIWPTGIEFAHNIVTGTSSGFQALVTDGAAAKVIGGTYIASNNGLPLTIAANGKNRGEAVIIMGVTTKGVRPYYVDICSSFSIVGNVFEGVSSASAIGQLTDVANGTFAFNQINGFWNQNQLTTNSGYTTDHVLIMGQFGNANAQGFSVNQIKNTNGSWGTGDIQFKNVTGLYGPYNVVKMSASKWTSDNLLWTDGEYNGNPNGVVEGDAGSTLRDPTNGRMYFKTAGTKTASHWMTVCTS